MDTPILAVDLGKFNSVLCRYDPRQPRCCVPHRPHLSPPTSAAHSPVSPSPSSPGTSPE
jgi:hypothetical protein